MTENIFPEFFFVGGQGNAPLRSPTPMAGPQAPHQLNPALDYDSLLYVSADFFIQHKVMCCLLGYRFLFWQAGRWLDYMPSANVVAMATKIGPLVGPNVSGLYCIQADLQAFLWKIAQICQNSVAMATRVGPQHFAWFHCIGHPWKPPIRPKHFWLCAAPRLGVYYFLSLTLSVCRSVCLSRCFFKSLLLSCFSMESPFFGRQFSMWHSTKLFSSIFDLGPLTPNMYSPKFALAQNCL